MQGRCKPCAAKANADTYQRLPKRRQKIREWTRAKARKDSEFVSRYKRFCGCRLCDESHPSALDMHHLDSAEKDANIPNLIGCARSRLKEEMRKCVVLCANCHRKHHAGVEGYEL